MNDAARAKRRRRAILALKIATLPVSFPWFVLVGMVQGSNGGGRGDRHREPEDEDTWGPGFEVRDGHLVEPTSGVEPGVPPDW